MISFVCLCVCGIGNITSELKNLNKKPKLFFSRISNMCSTGLIALLYQL